MSIISIILLSFEDLDMQQECCDFNKLTMIISELAVSETRNRLHC